MSRVPASPHFFVPLERALLAGFAALCLLALLVPAPLEVTADPASPPNPAKSAWFLLWIQELVSYDTRAAWGALTLAALLFALPWLPITPVSRARWFAREHRWLCLVVALITGAVVILTVVGLLFRGANWRLVLPF